MDFIFPILIVGGGIAFFVYMLALKGHLGNSLEDKAKEAKEDLHARRDQALAELDARRDDALAAINRQKPGSDGKPASEE